MKKYIYFLIIICFIVSIFSCNDDENNIYCINCEQLKNGLLSYDNNIIYDEVNEILKNLQPQAIENDPIGHEENFNNFVKQLNDCDGLTAELLCYACIKTYPAQTELLISIDSTDKKVSRILDILTPEDSSLSFVRIHEAYNLENISLQSKNNLGCQQEISEKSVVSEKTITDTIYYVIEDNVLTLNVIKNYNCCGLLNDSVNIDDGNVNIYIADTCIVNCQCWCMCDFRFEYEFTDFWQKNIHFYVYLKELDETGYTLWKQTKFTDGLD